MKTVFINLHGDTNMTAAYLHSVISKAGFDIKTIHFRRLSYEFNDAKNTEMVLLKRIVKKIDPEIILMSVNSMSFWNAIAITNMFKDKLVVWGGIQPMIDPKRCMDHVNVIVRGEGEGAVIDILNAVKNNHPLDKIKNVWIKKQNKIIKNDFRHLIDNLDELPLPDYSQKNKIYIFGKKVYFNENPIPHFKYHYETTFSRGCPFSCNYCINHYYNKIFHHKYLRRRSVESAIKELLFAKKMFPKLKSISFWDDIFITDLIWLRKFAEEYKKKINLPFFAYGNAMLVKEETMRILKYAGLTFFDIGVQTGNEKIRKEKFGRVDTDEHIIRANRILNKLKIKHAYDIIFSEFETEKSINRGIKFLLNFKKPYRIFLNKLAYYPNFKITNMAIKEGLINPDNIASVNPKIRTQVGLSEKFERKDIMINYYLIMGKKFIPNSLINYMLNNYWHIKHPSILLNMTKFVDKFNQLNYLFSSSWSLLISGEFEYVFNRIFKKFN